jgi:MOSC domain-containing protein YiiM
MQLEHTDAHIFQISISNGGVPKRAIPEAALGELGLRGDVQRHPKFHGGPERALCLFSLEKILALQREGHPIFPGAVGENLTLSGVDWELLLPGRRLCLGDEVLVEITSFTTPCNHIAPYFKNEDKDRILQKKHPGWSRVYARVLATGALRTGDRVVLLPEEA